MNDHPHQNSNESYVIVEKQDTCINQTQLKQLPTLHVYYQHYSVNLPASLKKLVPKYISQVKLSNNG